MPLLLEALLTRLISLGFPICGLLSQPGSLSCPSTPACLLVQPAHEKVRALKVRASGLHLSPQPRPIPSAVPGKEMAGRQCLWKKERKAADTCKLYNKHIRGVSQGFSLLACSLLPALLGIAEIRGCNSYTRVILKYSMAIEQRLFSTWLRSCQHPSSHASTFPMLHLSDPARTPG